MLGVPSLLTMGPERELAYEGRVADGDTSWMRVVQGGSVYEG